MDAVKKHNRRKKFIIELMDAMFIMVLCFATLLTAMLMSGKADGVLSYVIHFKTLSAVIVSLIVYLAYVLRQSDKELKAMIHELYTVNEGSGDHLEEVQQ